MDENIRTAGGILALILLILFSGIGGYLLWDRHGWIKFLEEHHCKLLSKKDTEIRLSSWGSRRSSGPRKFHYPVYEYICDNSEKYETSWYYDREEQENSKSKIRS